ncbi:hypothetical protein NFI96_008427 [Prochilodus magdalenae]|nr:hypothetical protein NFI96_008427 [Prochilodus magdalenae]
MQGLFIQSLTATESSPNSDQLGFCVRLWSQDPPRATLTVEPEGPLFTGESVTLKCEIQSYSNWRYQWYKGSSGTAVSQSQTHAFTIRSAADQGRYWCRGERDNRPRSSQNSRTVTLTVEVVFVAQFLLALSVLGLVHGWAGTPPKPTLTVEPRWSPLFTGESVTLTCEINPHVGRTYQFSKQSEHSEWTAVSPSEYHTVNGNTLTIREDAVFNGDQYRCRGEIPNRPASSQDSDSVTLTVEDPPKPTLTVEPKWSPLFTGESVTLKCVINTHSGRTYQWYKLYYTNEWNEVSQSEYHTVNGGTLTIKGDPVISGDQYCCRGEIPNRPKSSQNSDSFTLTVEDMYDVMPTRTTTLYV